MSKVCSNFGSFSRTILCAGICLVAFGLSNAAANAATYTVSNTNGSGAGSLSGSIASANATIDNDAIVFAIPAADPNCPGGVCTITMAGEVGVLDAATSGALMITNSTGPRNLLISGNNTFRILAMASGANLTLTGVTITKGYAYRGGAVYNYIGTLSVIDSIISGNTAQQKGGGICNEYGSTTVTNSTISGNTSESEGGGVLNYNGTLSMTNSTVSGNAATGAGYGGGVLSQYGTLNLTSVTIAFNSSAAYGGGLSSYGNLGANVHNTIISNNTAGTGSDLDGSIASTGTFNLIGSAIDPKLDPALALNGGTTPNHALLYGSPAIGQGNGTVTDQRGFARPVNLISYSNAIGGNGADIGAFEVQGAAADVDTDYDGISDAEDNCPETANADQADNDGDAIGDVCDVDDDNDGQSDADESGCGGSDPLDATRKSPDNDSDNLPDCVDTDDDNDTVLDGRDNCPLSANSNQADFDGDGVGDVCDTPLPTNKDQCKRNGWQFWMPRFKKEGDCVRFFTTGR